MGLEAATYIHQLDPNNPVGGADPKSQGDDHIKLTKLTLQNTFPNVEGEVTSSHAELNILDGVTATAAELNKMDGFTGSPTDLNNILSRLGGVKIAFCRVNASGTAIDTTQANKNITSIAHVNGSGAYVIDYTAAGFTLPPIISVIGVNVLSSRFSTNTPTATAATIQLYNDSTILTDGLFYFIAVGV